MEKEIDHLESKFKLNFMLKKKKLFFLIIRVVDEKSGRAISVESTQKGLQFYTGNFLNGVKGHNGALYNKHGALCLETQNYSDSVNNQVNIIFNIKKIYCFLFSLNFQVLFFVPVKNIMSKQPSVSIWNNSFI
jgi:galactose mutarotase-like enzyme